MSKDEELREMDHAAQEAREELFRNLDSWSARDVAIWWARWYMRAGHKRLGRLLVDLAKQLRDWGSFLARPLTATDEVVALPSASLPIHAPRVGTRDNPPAAITSWF